VIAAVSFWEELCHSAGWPSDEAQMHNICVSFQSDLYQRLPLADFVAKVDQLSDWQLEIGSVVQLLLGRFRRAGCPSSYALRQS